MVKLLLIFSSFGAITVITRACYEILSIFNDRIAEYQKNRTAKYAERLFLKFSKK